MVAPVGVMSVSVVFDAPSRMSLVGCFFSLPPPFPCLARSKNPVGMVSTPDLRREGDKVVGDGGFMDNIDPGVLGAEVVVVRFGGAE